ncbi:MAG: tetratricopeptide repeat protein [Candidatus Magnetominusculus sp. LBB02]|nr:tetratricopeptide repeat protein [Candidatus Magnetominusculus sp. LBB02]
MAVTLPVILLLLDYWPLKRISGGNIRGSLMYLIKEKAHLFILSLIFSFAAIYTQQGAMMSFSTAPFSRRFLNVPVHYMTYIAKMFYPDNLSIFHPYDTTVVYQSLLAWLFIICVSAYVIKIIQRHTYYFIGWFWFVIVLFPVSGFFQAGGQSIAERYTYIPYVGLFLILSYALPDLFERLKIRRYLGIIMISFITILLIEISCLQVFVWRDTKKLFTHAVEVTKNNAIAYQNIGFSLLKEVYLDDIVSGRVAYAKYTIPIYDNLTALSERTAKLNEAIDNFKMAIEIAPQYALAYYQIGQSYLYMGEYKHSMEYYIKALNLKPEDERIIKKISIARAGIRRMNQGSATH